MRCDIDMGTRLAHSEREEEKQKGNEQV